MASPSPAHSERLTRKALVDVALRAAGWRVVPFSEGPLGSVELCAVEEFPTSNGPADYALVLGGRVAGVVEAKKLSLGPQNVLSQKERYSRGLHQPGADYGGFGASFLYSTNGAVTWYHDVRHDLSRSRPVDGFHTPDALAGYLGRDDGTALERLRALPNDSPRLRPYQCEANTAIEAALRDRKGRTSKVK